MTRNAGSKRDGDGRRQIFAIKAPEARNVKLAGNFARRMERPITLRKTGSGVWQTAVNLPLGIHHYRFLIDGECRDDPNCALRESNSYGGLDYVRQVS